MHNDINDSIKARLYDMKEPHILIQKKLNLSLKKEQLF